MREQLAAEASELVESLIRDNFAEVFEKTGGDVGKTMEALAVLVEDELTDLTTKAVRLGAEGAKKAMGG